jgi:ribosomal protein L11 methylase PrmA
MHLHLHAKAEEKWGRQSLTQDSPNARKSRVAPSSSNDSRPLLQSLERGIEALRWEPRSAWASYYAEQASYEQPAFDRKRAVLAGWLERLRPRTVWDLGANTGRFSKLAVERGADAVAFDRDPACVELMYRDVKASKAERLLPLIADLANPSPGIGWGNAERMTLDQRGPVDLLLALALMHHLAIGNNVPFAGIADYFSRLARRAIVEFVPRTDAMVTRMMGGREDAFPDYDAAHFERAFAAHFEIDERIVLTPSDRALYLFTAR